MGLRLEFQEPAMRRAMPTVAGATPRAAKNAANQIVRGYPGVAGGRLNQFSLANGFDAGTPNRYTVLRLPSQVGGIGSSGQGGLRRPFSVNVASSA